MPEGDRDATEVEAKFSVREPDVLRALIEMPEPERLAGFVAAGPVHLDIATDRYLDTDASDGRLRRAGMRARLRCAHDGVVLAVKRAGIDHGRVSSRTELEGPATTAIDPEVWPPSAARDALLEATRPSGLIEIACLRQRRLTRTLGNGSATVQLSLDEIEALDGEVALDRRVELEAELKTGPRAALERLADALAVLDGVEPALGSKLEFALAARRGEGRPEITSR